MAVWYGMEITFVLSCFPPGTCFMCANLLVRPWKLLNHLLVEIRFFFFHFARNFFWQDISSLPSLWAFYIVLCWMSSEIDHLDVLLPWWKGAFYVVPDCVEDLMTYVVRSYSVEHLLPSVMGDPSIIFSISWVTKLPDIFRRCWLLLREGFRLTIEWMVTFAKGKE